MKKGCWMRSPPTGPGSGVGLLMSSSDEKLHGGGNDVSVGVVAPLPVDVFHYDVAEGARLEGEVDPGGPYGGVGVAAKVSCDIVLRPTHGDGGAKLDPVMCFLAEGESDTIDVGVGMLGTTLDAALLDDHLGSR